MTALTNEQLITLAQSGDVAARQALVMNVLFLVMSLASKRVREGDRREYWGQAAIQIDRAIDRFDPARGVKFSSYAGGAGRWLFPNAQKRGKQRRRELQVTALELRNLQAPESEHAPCGCVFEAVSLMPKRLACVIRMRADGAVLNDVGRLMGVQKERIRQLQLDAVRFLRTDLRNWCAACREEYAERN